jgi:glutaredoxin 3
MYTGDACSYCVRAKHFLTKKGVTFEEIYIDRYDPAARDHLVALTGRYTVPQILIGDTPIGGWDEMKALSDAGELDALLRPA